MTVKDHIHQYVRCIGRITVNNKDSKMINYYKCADSNCSHYMQARLILGKKSICNRCGQVFILPISVRALTNRPHCKACTKKAMKIEPVAPAPPVFEPDELEMVDE
jgi:hypothetical protein